MKKVSFLFSFILGVILFAFTSVPTAQAQGIGVCNTAFAACIALPNPATCSLEVACTAACAPYSLLGRAQENCICVSDGQCASGFCNRQLLAVGTCKPVADCSCDEPNTGNGYTCTLNGNTFHGTCTDSARTCRDAPGRRPDDSLLQFVPNLTDIFNGAGISGIDCGNRSLLGDILNRPTQPPPPSPPCANFANDGSCTSVETAFGNISTEPGSFVTRIAGILIAAAGAIAVLLIMRAGYRIMTARGNPEGLQQGREQLTAAIVGLLFIIFSFVILEVIGVDLLQIPGTLPTAVTPGSGEGSGLPSATCTGIHGNCISSSQCSQQGGINRGRLDCEGGGVVCCQPTGSTAGSCTVAGGSCISSSTCSSQGGNNLGRLDCEGGGVVCCQPTGSTAGSCTAADGSCISSSVCDSQGRTNLGRLDCEGGGIVCCR